MTTEPTPGAPPAAPPAAPSAPPPATPPATPPGASLLGDNGGAGGGSTVAGNGGNDFIATLPEDLRGVPTLQGFKDVGSLAKAFVDAKALVGADTIKLPGKDAKPEELEAIYDKLGRPETADGYKIEVRLPEGFERDEKVEAVVRPVMHKLGLSQQQAAGLIEWYYGMGIEGAQADQRTIASQTAETQTALKQKWGGAYAERMGLVNRFFSDEVVPGGSAALQAVNAAGLGRDPAFLAWVGELAAGLREGRVVGGGGATLQQTAEQARAEIARVTADKAHPYWNENDPGNKAARAEMDRLYKLANPPQQ